jgi:hypothetical protein
MTKGSGDCARWVGSSHENLIPHQWWFWTGQLRAWVLEHIFPITFPFLAWVHSYRQELEAQGLARFRRLELSDPAAPITYEVNWIGCEVLAQLIYIWQLDSWDAEWERNHRTSTWQP